MHTDLAVCPT